MSPSGFEEAPSENPEGDWVNTEFSLELVGNRGKPLLSSCALLWSGNIEPSMLLLFVFPVASFFFGHK